MSILATLVYKQPAWLHKIVSHALMNILLKCLKTDLDIPVLLSGLLVVAALLPVVPVTIKEHLPHLFDVFSRLASLCLKPPAHVPELYKYHLQVGVYCLHHRLYGMYPYHFLTYLRNIYSKQEQQEVFENIVKPMVDKVRLHPLLFTTTREKEVSRERWRQKEVHDILVECAQFSLDLTEGSTAEMSVPGMQKTPEQSRSASKLFQNLSELMAPSAGSLVGNVDPSMVMTYAVTGSGVMTPPLGQSSDPQTPVMQGVASTTSGQQGSALDSPGPEERNTKVKKRLSQTGLSLAAKLPSSVETTPLYPDHCSIPPSPLRPDFSTEPPLHAPPLHAIRKLSFQHSETKFNTDVGQALEKIIGNADKIPQLPVATKTSAGSQQMQAEQVAPSTSQKAPSGEILKLAAESEAPTDQARDGDDAVAMDTVHRPVSLDNSPEKVLPPGDEASTVPSLTNLPKFLDTLENQTEDTDTEVTELTSDTADTTPDGTEGGDFYSEDSDAPSQLPNAASVAAFMKKINRIRFNSINVSADRMEPPTKATTTRPRSCPNLEVHLQGEPQGGRDEDSLASFSIDSPSVSLSVDEKRAEKIMRSSSSQTSLYALSTALLKTKKDKVVLTDTTGTETESVDGEFPIDDFPYQELFSMALPFSPFIQCYTCTKKQSIQAVSGQHNKARTQPALDDVRPLYSTCSPAELLDCLLNESAGSHHRARAGLSPGAQTHVPDLSSCDDVTILRGQIEMLRHELLYERHKREQHAQRNRRLLSRTVKTTALQEQNIAMRDQLQLQELELSSLRQALQTQQRHSQQLQHTTATHEAELERIQKTYRQKLEGLATQKTELESELQAAKQEKNKANKELQGFQAQVHSLSTEVQVLSNQTDTTTDLQGQVKRLNKELLLMGELQQKYQSRLVAHTMSESNNIHTQFLLDTYKHERNSAKKSLSVKTIGLEAAESKLSALTEAISLKDKAIQEQKELIETARDTYREEQQAVEDRYASLKKLHLALQTEFLNVYEQIGRLEAQAQRNSRQRAPRGMEAPHRAGRDEGAAVGAEGGAEGITEWDDLKTSGCSNPEEGARQDIPDSWKAPASESSVESAEEAFNMDTSSQ